MEASARKVSDLTVGEFQAMIRETVLDTLLELTGDSVDPDEGLHFRPEIEERLLRLMREQPGGRTLDEVAQDLGLERVMSLG